MPSLNTNGKTAYVYDQGTDTFYAIGANTNTAANYIWSGTQEFQNNVTFSEYLQIKGNDKMYLDNLF